MNKKIVFKLLPKLVLTLHSFSVMLGISTVAQAAPLAGTQDGNILTENQTSQASINQLIADIKSKANGPITQANVGVAVSEALAGTPGVSMNTIAAAINELNLTTNVLKTAMDSVSTATGASQENILAALISNTYMSQGREAADRYVASLRATFGNDAVNKALEQGPTASMQDASQLAQIQPAAGGEDVYTG